MILIGLGANEPSAIGPPEATLTAALAALAAEGVTLDARSRWYRSAPVPPSDQPWFTNAVARVSSALAPEALLALLHRIEARFGRERRFANEPRAIDLDLLAMGDLVRAAPPPILPHPRLHLRAFVLLPLQEVAPGWRHPASGRTVEELIAALPEDQPAVPEESEKIPAKPCCDWDST